MSFRNLLAKGAFAAQMIDLGLPQIVQNLKAQAWTDEVRSFLNLWIFKYSVGKYIQNDILEKKKYIQNG